MSEKLGVIFQGTKSGLTIALDETQPFNDLLSQLKKKLDDSGYFFSDANVTLNLGRRDISEEQFDLIKKITSNGPGLNVTGIKTYSDVSLATAKKLGLQAILNQENHAEKPAASQSTSPKLPALPASLVRNTIRSGQIYESPGHLVILGDVNYGAEIAAAGDIIVFGSLRGNAFAGATGRKQAIVAALHLAPMLLRIDQAVARCQEKKSSQKAEFAFIENGKIVIDDWTNKNRLSIVDSENI
ncbi:MAG: septum site-determining protein MinC [Calditrichaeota bacterium]|nr:MAG: septum site-determining protein MinC [Calditrichota bacterium]